MPSATSLFPQGHKCAHVLVVSQPELAQDAEEGEDYLDKWLHRKAPRPGGAEEQAVPAP